MLLVDGPLSFGEFMSGEELPLAVVFREVLDFLKRRPDMALFGAHAVNAYCEPARMITGAERRGDGYASPVRLTGAERRGARPRPRSPSHPPGTRSPPPARP